MSSSIIVRAVLLLGVLVACVSIFLGSAPRPTDTSLLLPESLSSSATNTARRALIWTAHPDDESMFFAPVVQVLVKQEWEVDALCMSIGDADGKGAVRREELLEAYEVLGVPRSRVRAVDHTELQDGMSTDWPVDTLIRELERHLASRPADVIITFDGTGVSQHANHRALHAALSAFIAGRSADATPLRGWQLVSQSLPRKFSGVVGLALRHVSGVLGDVVWRHVLAPPAQRGTSGDEVTGKTGEKDTRTVEVAPAWIGESVQDFIAESRAALGPRVRFSHGLEGYRTALRAMRRHRSQMVWFRWGYVATSRYMWEAELGEIRVGGEEKSEV